LSPFEITSRQAYTLYIMFQLGRKTTLAELAKYHKREVTTLSLHMTRMENDGLVKKARAKRKSRLLSFELTEKGIDIYHKSKEVNSIRDIMSTISEEKQRQLISVLEEIENGAENLPNKL